MASIVPLYRVLKRATRPCADGSFQPTIRELTGQIALVSDEDAERVARHYWYISRGSYGYVTTTLRDAAGQRRTVSLHRFVMGDLEGLIPPGLVVDHINRLTCDNRRSNLRVVTQAENMGNKPYRSNTGKTDYSALLREFAHVEELRYVS